MTKVFSLILLLTAASAGLVVVAMGQSPEQPPVAVPTLPLNTPPAYPPTALPSSTDPAIEPKTVPSIPPLGQLPAPMSEVPSQPPATIPSTPALSPLPSEGAAEQTNENPTGRQEPAVSLEWIGPATAKLGQPVTFQIVVRNISASPVQQVVVRNKVPTGTKIAATEPKASNDGEVLIWNLGTMDPRQEKRIDLQMVPGSTGNQACQAFVTFTGASTARLTVHEPKLNVKVAAPPKVIIGDVAGVMLTVNNPGDASADHVKVKVVLTEGLEHARGKTVEFDLGNLAPNESRNVQVLCAAKGAGEQKCEATATAESNITAQDTGTLEVLMPKLDLAVTGPGMRYLDRHAIYTFKLTNPGTAPANHVRLVNLVPQGFKFVNASHNGKHDFVTRTVTWFLPDLPPSQSQEVTMEVVAVNAGDHKNRAVAVAARSLRSDNEITTKVEGLPALLMELVDLDDPVEVNAETSYEIRVTNTGTKTETNLQLVCTVPDKMEFKGARGPVGCESKLEGNEVVFDPLPKLAPRADAIYRVRVKGTAAGDLRFRARIKADGLADPVNKEESTKVYGDESVPK